MLIAKRNRITTGVTATPVTTHVHPASCVLFQVVVSCSNAGTTWTMNLQDLAKDPILGTPLPFVWIPAFTLTVPTTGLPNVVLYFQEPIPMDGGIDIVTTGGAPGVVCVCCVIDDGR